MMKLDSPNQEFPNTETVRPSEDMPESPYSHTLFLNIDAGLSWDGWSLATGDLVSPGSEH